MTLAYQQYHKHSNRPLVLVHGFLGSGELFSPNIRQLRKHINITTVDLPGFGESAEQPSACNISDMAKQVLVKLDELSCPQFDLLGHSMGGMVALQMALLAPQRIATLILYATNSDGDIPERFETFEETKARLRQNLPMAKQHICATWFCAGAKHQHFPLALRCANTVTLQTTIDAVSAMQNFNATEEAAQIEQPVLIIGAEKDRTYSPRLVQTLHARIRQSQLRILKNCAHNAHLEAEKEFNALLLEWLAVT